jgi:hypothetical protein
VTSSCGRPRHLIVVGGIHQGCGFSTPVIISPQN